MNNLIKPTKFHADGSLNPRHELSKPAIVVIDDSQIYSTRDMLRLYCQNYASIHCSYLGHVIGRDGSEPGHKKVQSAADWPTPTCLCKVLHFLGLAEFFIRFVQGYARCEVKTTSKPTGLLQPLDAPPYAWHTVRTDYITGLPLTP